MMALSTRSAPSASIATHATSAESIPPDSPEHHALKLVRVHLVPKPERQRIIDLCLNRR